MLTVDIAIVAEQHIVLIRRTKPPFMDKLVLPGGHVESNDESLAHAACRELEEEVGLVATTNDLHQFTTLDSIHRDPRGRKISIVFKLCLDSVDQMNHCQAGSDAREVIIRRIDTISHDEIGFDHWLVIQKLKGEK